MKVVSYAGATFSFNSGMMAKKYWFGRPSEVRRPDTVRREDTKDYSNQDLCHQHSEMSSQLIQKIPQSPAQWK